MSDSDGIESDGGPGESEDEGSDDEFDYGFMGAADDDDDEEEYEVSYAGMNVSPEILRMLGASEEVIAAKEAEIAGIAWVPPTETGLEHSAAIASCDDVALGQGHDAKGSNSVARVFKAVGSYDASRASKNPPPIDNDDTPALAEKSNSPAVLKLKIAHGPEPVPEKLQSRLPPPEDGEDGNSSGSDTSWDEESIIDGHAWWEIGSDEDIDDDIIERTSPNLRSLLGLSNPAEDGEKKEGVWRPPMFSGLQNSKPVVTLSALAVGKEKGLEIKYKKTTTTPGDGDADEEEDWDSDEEGWDFEDVPDEEYILDWSTSISPNLAGAMEMSSTKRKSLVLTEECSWKPPTFSGLGNSSPIIRADAV